MEEKESFKLKVSNVFRVSRKLANENQKEFASRLGITQGTISKLENGSLGPDAVLWYLFCKEYNLHADITYKTGLLFFKEQVLFKGNEFKMGSYGLERFIKVKEIIPFLKSTEELNIKNKYLNYMKERFVDCDAFLIPEYIVPFELLREIVDFSINKTSKSDFLNSSVKYFVAEKEEIIHDMNFTYKQFIRYINTNDSLFDIHTRGNLIKVNVYSKFISEKSKESLESYLSWKVRAISETLMKAFSFKGLKYFKVDEFCYEIGLK